MVMTSRPAQTKGLDVGTKVVRDGECGANGLATIGCLHATPDVSRAHRGAQPRAKGRGSAGGQEGSSSRAVRLSEMFAVKVERERGHLLAAGVYASAEQWHARQADACWVVTAEADVARRTPHGATTAEMLNRHRPISALPAVRHAASLVVERTAGRVPAWLAQRRAEPKGCARSVLAEKRRPAHA